MTLNMNFDPAKIKVPTFGRLFKEPLGISELINIVPAWPLLEALPPGDGQPVMVIPGLTTNDISTKIIRTFLKSKNFNAYGWGLGVNIKYTEELERRMIERVDSIAQKHGRKVALIGWSLGGITIRLLASHAPEHIAQLISLGAPFTNVTGRTHVSWWYRLLAGESVKDFRPEWLNELPVQPSMPSTSIYSKTDGMVSWEYCIDWDTGPQTQNIEVYCNHLGFGMNPVVWMIVHDRLRQDTNNWQLFDESKIAEFEETALFHV
jgi:pimeloyl-ACP methyl ester carboxylesterase